MAPSFLEGRGAAVLYVKDVAKVAAFYEHVVGLEPTEVDEGYVVLSSPGMDLVVVQMRPEVADGVEISDPPQAREDTPIKLVFGVPSLAGARESAPSFGAKLRPPEREWEFHGRRVCDGVAPEGNVVQLGEAI